MKWVLSQHSTALLWLNAPIIGGWAVLFIPRKYIFRLVEVSLTNSPSNT